MDIALSATIGILFLLTGAAAVFLMLHLWRFPVDPRTGARAAPLVLLRLHRAIGWVYVLLYLVMMVEMVPRLWTYQIELPARSVAHVALGIAIGVLLLVKLSILRFFRHLGEWLPGLGVGLFTATVLVSSLSLPFALREYALASSAIGGGVYSEENRERVARLLPGAGLPPEAPLAELATVDALREGRDVLVTKCVVCHDLKTILVRPRAPADWVKTTLRMADKPSFTAPLQDRELWVAAAYLIAITRDLQRDLRDRQHREAGRADALAALQAPGLTAAAPDPARARRTYEALCAQCHELADVEAHPPRSADEVDAMLRRMIDDNGMEATEEELILVRFHLLTTYAG